MGGLGQDSSIFFSPPPSHVSHPPHRRLTNGNILIPAFIPQDWKHNFMITSLLEPCLIIPNYAARHLVLSVSPTTPPAHSCLAALCVFSHLDIIDEHVAPPPAPLQPPSHTHTHLSRLQRRDLRCSFNNRACYCPGGSLLCVSRLQPFFSNLLRSLPKHEACGVAGPDMWRTQPAHRDDFQREREKKNPKTCKRLKRKAVCSCCRFFFFFFFTSLTVFPLMFHKTYKPRSE